MSIRSPAHAAFGEAIRQTRGELGLSQEALAEACDLDRTYISGIERGARNPSLTNILKIAAALNVRAADLLARTEDLQRTNPLARPAVARTTNRPGPRTD
jgi:transcriptional regulator with XRE-family HTH domain